MEKKMEATIGFRVSGLLDLGSFLPLVSPEIMENPMEKNMEN